jgi:hypothetical protein
MAIPPPRLRDGETGSDLTTRSWFVGVGGGEEPEERERDADPEDEDVDAIRREKDDGVLGGICRTGEFPAWMLLSTTAWGASTTASAVRVVPRRRPRRALV